MCLNQRPSSEGIEAADQDRVAILVLYYVSISALAPKGLKPRPALPPAAKLAEVSISALAPKGLKLLMHLIMVHLLF